MPTELQKFEWSNLPEEVMKERRGMMAELFDKVGDEDPKRHS